MLSKFLKLFAADPFVAPQSIDDKVAELKEQAEKEHAEAVRRLQDAHLASQLLWAQVAAYTDEASRLKALAEKLGDLIDPAA